MTADYFDGAVLDGPVPRFFATNPTEARAALSADASKAYKDIQRIYARLFITKNIPACDAWAFVGNPRKDNMKLFKKKKLITATFSISRAFVKAKIYTLSVYRQKDFVFAYKRGPYPTPHEPEDSSGPSSAQNEPARKRPRTGDPAPVAETTPPSPGRNRSTVTYLRYKKYHPYAVNKLRFSLGFYYGINGNLL